MCLSAGRQGIQLRSVESIFLRNGSRYPFRFYILYKAIITQFYAKVLKNEKFIKHQGLKGYSFFKFPPQDKPHKGTG